MSLQDRIAKLLLFKHDRVLSNKTAQGGYWTSIKTKIQKADQDIIDSASIKVKFGSGAKLVCEVVDNERAQTVGLQKYASLPDGYGMIFPYNEPRQVTFHMGTVPFPIDIMFVGSNGRISKIVEYAEPGTREKWSMSHVSAVIEANAGFCRSNKISVGDMVNAPLVKDSQMNNGIDPGDRFKGHDLIDNQLNGQSADPANFSYVNGNDPMLEMADDADPTRSSP